MAYPQPAYEVVRLRRSRSRAPAAAAVARVPLASPSRPARPLPHADVRGVLLRARFSVPPASAARSVAYLHAQGSGQGSGVRVRDQVGFGGWRFGLEGWQATFRRRITRAVLQEVRHFVCLQHVHSPFLPLQTSTCASSYEYYYSKLQNPSNPLLCRRKPAAPPIDLRGVEGAQRARRSFDTHVSGWGGGGVRVGAAAMGLRVLVEVRVRDWG